MNLSTKMFLDSVYSEPNLLARCRLLIFSGVRFLKNLQSQPHVSTLQKASDSMAL